MFNTNNPFTSNLINLYKRIYLNNNDNYYIYLSIKYQITYVPEVRMWKK